MSYPIVWLPSPKHTPGHPASLIAIVHHRMVGTLAGTDATFTTGTRVASTNFGIGYCTKHSAARRLCIHQYVALGDQAWGNGNWDATGQWDDHYPTTLINSRTVSIEHQDNGGLSAGDGKGIVPEAVIEASIWLDSLLLRGKRAELAAAGVHVLTDAFCAELAKIPVDRHHIVDHHYISGRLKPSCWQPWADDKIGFPQARYLAVLAVSVTPPTGDAVKSFLLPEVRTLATIRDGAWLHMDSSMAPDPANVSVSPSRELVLVGVFSAGVTIVAYEPRDGDIEATSKAMFVATSDIVSKRAAPDATPFSQVQLDAAEKLAAAAVKAAADRAAATYGA